ncbi:MAG: hypothetical protein JWO82_3205 [Akkermansiaceae bacterium]|nr:hypothetical protein [Akkermansiaceae bacterium]
MSDPADRFVQAITLPFAGNAEALVKADTEIRALLAAGAPTDSVLDAAATRLAAAAVRRKAASLARYALYLLSAVISLTIAFFAIQYWLNTGFNTGLPLPAKPSFIKEKSLSQQLAPGIALRQRLLLFGDRSAPTTSAAKKALWDSEPDNPAYFCDYAIACYSNKNGLPPDFLATARRIDPGNGWYQAFAAGVLAKQAAVAQPKPTVAKKPDWVLRWNILDPQKLETCWSLLQESATQPRFTSYETSLLRQRIAQLPTGGGNVEACRNAFYVSIYSANSGSLRFRTLADVVGAKAQLAAEAKDPALLKEIIAGWDRFDAVYQRNEEVSVIDSLVRATVLRGVSANLAADAGKLGLPEEAARFRALKDQLQLWSQKPDSDFPGLPRKASMLGGLTLPTILKQSRTLRFDEEKLTPGRYSEHELFGAVLATAGILLLAAVCILTALYRFRAARLIATLARQGAALLQPIDWLWLIGLGTVLPFVVFQFISRTGFPGGRDYSLTASRFAAPIFAFEAFILLLIGLPVVIARWRLGRRAGFLGIAWTRRPWVGVAMASLAVIGCLTFGAYFTAESPPAWITAIEMAIFGLIHGWLILIVSRALFSRRENLLKRLTLARSVLPCYALALLLVALTVPLSRTLECYWLRQDRLTEVTPEAPAMSHFEYDVARSILADLKQIAESSPP